MNYKTGIYSIVGLFLVSSLIAAYCGEYISLVLFLVSVVVAFISLKGSVSGGSGNLSELGQKINEVLVKAEMETFHQELHTLICKLRWQGLRGE